MTHCDRVLALLRDGKTHSHLELYQLRVIAHSRVADLRKRGCIIACWREGDLSMYRLISEPEISAGGMDPDAEGGLLPIPPSSAPAEQLAMEAA